MFQKSLLVLTILFISVESHNCQIKFKYSKICNFYKFNEKCINGQKEFCKLIVTKRDELKCPFYICPKVSLVENKENNFTKIAQKSNISDNLISGQKLTDNFNESKLLTVHNVQNVSNSSIKSDKNKRLISQFNSSLKQTNLNFNVNSTAQNLSIANVKSVEKKHFSLPVFKNKTKVSSVSNKHLTNSSNSHVKLNQFDSLKKQNYSETVLHLDISKKESVSTFKKVSLVKTNLSKTLTIKPSSHQVNNFNISNRNISTKKSVPLSNTKSFSFSDHLHNKRNGTNKLNSFSSSLKELKPSKDSKLLLLNYTQITDLKPNLTSFEKKHLSDIVKNSTVSQKSNERLNSYINNENENWQNLDNLRNFTIFQKVQKEHHKNITLNKLQEEIRIQNEKKNWIEVDKIANFSKFQTKVKKGIKKVLTKKLERIETYPKMEVNCTSSTCHLEFRELPLVIYFYCMKFYII
jgi:hypothetical protein